MGSRNFDLGARDMKAAGRIALERGMCSFASIDSMADRWNRFVDFAREHYEIGRMERISLDVVVAYGTWLADQVDEELLAESTAQNYVSAVNRVLEIARGDKSLHVSPTRDCGIPKRIGVAIDNLAVSAEEHKTWLGIIDPRIALLLELQRAFGLRFEESAKLDSRAVWQQSHTGWLNVTDGTKGGRKRRVPIVRDEQLVVLEQAAEAQGDDRSLIFGTMSYDDFRQECYRQSVRHGIRFHRERHAYAQQRYRDLVGVDCPVASGIDHGRAHHTWLAKQLGISLDAAKELDDTARDQIALELGHNRREVSNAYLG
jgi:site-specific recombinase XerC